MRQFITAICAALVAGCSFGVTFAPKEYVDRMDATNRDFVIEYVNAEVGNLVRKDNGGYILATNRAMTALQQHQSLEPVSNYLDSVIGFFSVTNMVPRLGTNRYWQDETGCVWSVTQQIGEWSVTNITTAQLDEDFEWYGPTWETESDGWYITDVPGWYISATTFTPELISKDFGLTEYRYEWSFYVETESIPVTTIFSRKVTEITNFVGRVVLTNDLTGLVSMDVTKTTDESKMLHEPSVQSARVVPDPVQSAYWPNRQRVLRLGDEDTVVTADRAEIRVLLVQDPTRLIFVDEETVDGNGQTNYTFKTFQQYLNAVSPDTLQDALRSYLPIEGGGTVTGNVSVTGNMLVSGTFEAPNLVRVVTADIEANGFSVSNGVLRANSGLVVSNGMCSINCARATIGIGTPRIHIEGDTDGSGITFGRTWDSPITDLKGLISNRVAVDMQLYTTFDDSKSIAHFPPVAPGFRSSQTLPNSIAPNGNGLLTLKNLKLNVVGDSEYHEYVVITLDELPNVKLVDLYVLFRYTTSVPTFYFDFGTFGETPVFHGNQSAFSPTAGTPRLVHMKHFGDDEWIITYEDLADSWTPALNDPSLYNE